jgi:hypothetical protein
MDIDNKLEELFGKILKSWKSDSGTLSPFSSSSSQHNEKNDNHLEYYVKTNNDASTNENVSDIFNSNSTNGGTTMENTQYETPAAVTTEPDSQGEQAITKVIDQVTRPDANVSVSDAPEGPVPTNETFPGEGNAVAPSSEEMAEAVEKAESGKCPSCGQAMPMAKAADEPETPAEDAKETAEDEKKEMKKSHSVWDGAFSPNINRGI